MRIHTGNLAVGLIFTLGTLLIPFWLEDIPVRSNADEIVLDGIGKLLVGTMPSERIESSRQSVFLMSRVENSGATFRGTGEKVEQQSPTYLELLGGMVTFVPGVHVILATSSRLTVLVQAFLSARQWNEHHARMTVLSPSSSPALSALARSGMVDVTLNTVLSPGETEQMIGVCEMCISGAGSFCDVVVVADRKAPSSRARSIPFHDFCLEHGVVDAVSLVVDFGPVDTESCLQTAAVVLHELTIRDGTHPHLMSSAVVHFYFATWSSTAQEQALQLLKAMLDAALRVRAVHGTCPWTGDLTHLVLTNIVSSGGLGRNCNMRQNLSPCAVWILPAGKSAPLLVVEGTSVGPSVTSSFGIVRLGVLLIAVGTGCSLVAGVSKNWVGRRRLAGKL